MSDAIDQCWQRIGVGGDGSCAELAQVVHCRNCPVFSRAARQVLDRPAPPAYLQQWAERLAEAEDEVAGDTLSTVVFRLAGHVLALPTAAVVEAVEPRPVHRIPHRGGAILRGLVNVRGELLLCVSLAGLLALAAGDDGAAAPRPRLAIAELDAARWAIPVDAVLGVHRIARDALQAPRADDAAAITARFALDDAGGLAVALLDPAQTGAALRQAVA